MISVCLIFAGEIMQIIVVWFFLLFRFDSGVDSIYDEDDSDLVSCLLLFLFLFLLFLFLQHTIVLLTTVVVF